jgi:hypothetical protein
MIKETMIVVSPTSLTVEEDPHPGVETDHPQNEVDLVQVVEVGEAAQPIKVGEGRQEVGLGHHQTETLTMQKPQSPEIPKTRSHQ